MLRISNIYENFRVLSGKQITVIGWIRSVRNGKQNSFVVLNDGSTMKDLQLFFPQDFQEKEKIKLLRIGSALQLSGLLQLTPDRQQPFEIIVRKVLNVASTDESYPIQKKNLPIEFVRDHQQLRTRTRYFLAIFRLRNSVSYLIHQFFQKENFIHIATPLITSNDAEGGGESFFLQTSKKNSFFDKKANLTVSGQLQLEALVQALGKVYNFSPCFRAENSNTTRHLAEFWMVEAEISFCNLEQLIETIEKMVKYISKGILRTNKEELQFFEQLKGETITTRLRSLLEKKFKIISYSECIQILNERESTESTLLEKISWGTDLSSENEKYISSYFEGPVFIKDYPSQLKAFYMKENHDKETVACVDLLFPSVGEVVGGSSREDDYERLVQRANLCKLSTEELRWYFDLRKNGYSPSAGFGLGLERFLMFITGIENIRDTIPFPRAAGELRF